MRQLRYGLVVAGFALALTSAAQAQPYGPGMMGGYGPGQRMMGGGYGPGWGMMGPGMMAGGYGPCAGMMGPGMMGYGMMGDGDGYGGGGYGGGYGPGWMMQGHGPGMMGYGGYYGNRGSLDLSVDQVKEYLARMIRNPNLKVGNVTKKDDDTIVAEVVTKDKEALVQRLDFNRHNGFVQPEQ